MIKKSLMNKDFYKDNRGANVQTNCSADEVRKIKKASTR